MTETVVSARRPFDFAASARFLRYTEAETVDNFHEGTYSRLVHFDNRLRLMQVRASAAGNTKTNLIVSLSPKSPVAVAKRETEEAAALVARMFSVGHDLKKFRARVAADSFMREIEREHRGLRLVRWPTLFEALTNSILAQQISTHVAQVFKRRLVERFGDSLIINGQKHFAYPRAENLAVANLEELRSLGLSSAKATSIIELARATLSDPAIQPSALEREDNACVIRRLSNLRGIGRWTAEFALILYFGRTDVFPAGDLALRAIVAKYCNGGRPMHERDVRQLAEERWGEWSSYVTIYFFAALRTGKITLRAS
jgi:DNA-3-methyladenine glycosylase II